MSTVCRTARRGGERGSVSVLMIDGSSTSVFNLYMTTLIYVMTQGSILEVFHRSSRLFLGLCRRVLFYRSRAVMLLTTL